MQFYDSLYMSIANSVSLVSVEGVYCKLPRSNELSKEDITNPSQKSVWFLLRINQYGLYVYDGEYIYPCEHTREGTLKILTPGEARINRSGIHFTLKDKEKIDENVQEFCTGIEQK